MYNIIAALSGPVVLLAAVIGIVFGVLQCFAGYKIMKAILAMEGLIIGAAAGMAAELLTGRLWLGITVGAILGIGIAVVLFRFYFAGVFIHVLICVGAFVLMLLHMVPIHIAAKIVIAALFGAAAGAGALFAVRPVFIISSAVWGATIIVYSTCALMGIAGGPAEHLYTSIALWIGLGAGGAICQFFTSSKHSMNMMSVIKKEQIKKESGTLTFSEKKYPGMQRAYRNFCINCGRELTDGGRCLGCGFEIND